MTRDAAQSEMNLQIQQLSELTQDQYPAKAQRKWITSKG